MVAAAHIAKQKAIEELSLEELKSFTEMIEQDVFEILTLDSCLKKRCAIGGTSIEQVSVALENAKKRLD